MKVAVLVAAAVIVDAARIAGVKSRKPRKNKTKPLNLALDIFYFVLIWIL